MCDNVEVFERQVGEPCQRFLDRGYVDNSRNCLERVRIIQRADWMTNQTKQNSSNNNPVTFVSTYGQISGSSKNIVHCPLAHDFEAVTWILAILGTYPGAFP